MNPSGRPTSRHSVSNTASQESGAGPVVHIRSATPDYAWLAQPHSGTPEWWPHRAPRLFPEADSAKLSARWKVEASLAPNPRRPWGVLRRPDPSISLYPGGLVTHGYIGALIRQCVFPEH